MPHPRHNDQIESGFNLRASRSLSTMLKEARLRGQSPHWIDKTSWQRLLAHWNPTLEKDEYLQTRGSIGTVQHAARKEVPSSSASSCSELTPNMVEVLLHRMVISSEETNQKLNEMMKFQQESLRIMDERQEKQEVIIPKLEHEHEDRLQLP